MGDWLRPAGVLLSLLLLTACATKNEVEPPPLLKGGVYDYPISDAFAATVVGTPVAYRLDLSNDYKVEALRLQIFPERVIPDIFWYNDRLEVAFAPQEGPAPLIFNIAGTGSGSDARLVRHLESVFVARGFHVISLPSPTFPNFVVSGSETSVPGRINDDARDLYHAMQVAYERVKDEIEVTEFYLTGYSLGAWEAAFVSALDEKEQVFDFKQVLMINPPVSLYRSISILDNLLIDNVQGGINGVPAFFDEVFAAFSEIYKRSSHVNFSDDFLFRIYKELEPSDQRLAALIGLAFRLSSNSMIFSADVMTDTGFIVPQGVKLDTGTSLTTYFQTGARVGFVDYLQEFYYPYFKRRDPELTREDLVDEASLKAIEGYLRETEKIGLITNRDDIILGPGDLTYLEAVFGPRARIFPTGGHLGNLEHRTVSAYVGNYFVN